MKTLGLTEEDLKEFYSKVVTYGVEILNNIDKMEALQLREYAIKILQTELYSLEEIVIKLPDFDYPVEYKNGKELDYWKKKSTSFSQAKFVSDSLLDFFNDSPHNKTVIKKPRKILPEKFSDIFASTDWNKYIEALKNSEPKLISEENEFIGKPKLHKGVICSYVKELQTKNIIKFTVNRKQLSHVFNNEIKNLNLGSDGKTFDNISNAYEDNFKEQLMKLIK
jgi:hypothetical protein